MKFTINRRSRTPLFEQIVDAIEIAIIAGRLKSNTCPFSVRSLAFQLGIDRKTAHRALQTLEKRERMWSEYRVGFRVISSDFDDRSIQAILRAGGECEELRHLCLRLGLASATFDALVKRAVLEQQ